MISLGRTLIRKTHLSIELGLKVKVNTLHLQNVLNKLNITREKNLKKKLSNNFSERKTIWERNMWQNISKSNTRKGGPRWIVYERSYMGLLDCIAGKPIAAPKECLLPSGTHPLWVSVLLQIMLQVACHIP